jgi:hypothetical protein
MVKTVQGKRIKRASTFDVKCTNTATIARINGIDMNSSPLILRQRAKLLARLM